MKQIIEEFKGGNVSNGGWGHQDRKTKSRFHALPVWNWKGT